MPIWARDVGLVLALTYYERITRGIILKSNTIGEIFSKCFPICLIALVLIVLALKVMKKTLIRKKMGILGQIVLMMLNFSTCYSAVLRSICCYTPYLLPQKPHYWHQNVDKQPEVTQRLWWKKLHDPVLNHLIKWHLPTAINCKFASQSFYRPRRSYKKRVLLGCPP